MVTKKKLAKAAIASVAAEMAKPRIAASAQKSLAKAPSQHRELVLIDQFFGFECSRCKCRFPESALHKGSSLSSSTAILQVQREFAEHVCP